MSKICWNCKHEKHKHGLKGCEVRTYDNTIDDDVFCRCEHPNKLQID